MTSDHKRSYAQKKFNPTGLCDVCGVYYAYHDIVRCSMCGQWVHDGPTIHCNVVYFELEEGRATLGAVNGGLEDRRQIAFPPWNGEVVRRTYDEEVGDVIICADCVLSDM